MDSDPVPTFQLDLDPDPDYRLSDIASVGAVAVFLTFLRSSFEEIKDVAEPSVIIGRIWIGIYFREGRCGSGSEKIIRILADANP